MNKRKAVILGATGAAGQNIVEFLDGHPWFDVSCLAASERSKGLKYREAIQGAAFFEKPPRDYVIEMVVEAVSDVDPRDYDVAFSALPSAVALGQEAAFAEHVPVVSTTAAYRYEEDVPVLIPDVNPGHVELVEAQREKRGWSGFIVPGPNCTTVGLATTLKPLHDAYGVETVSMVSMQALSGAGAKGLRADSPYRASAEMNVLPYIDGEEPKVEKETNKILGNVRDGRVVDAEIKVHATCTRVYVDTVHTEAVHLGTVKPHTLADVKKVLNGYRSQPQRLGLPSAPEAPLMVLDGEDMPQPRRHREYPDMVTLVGRLRENPLFRFGLSYVLTSDNLEKGAGGGAVLIAEYLLKKGCL